MLRHLRWPFLSTLCGLLMAGLSHAQTSNDSDEGPQSDQASYSQIIRSDKPVAYWRFDDQTSAGELGGSPWQPATTGKVKLAQPGPDRKRYPLFSAENKALLFGQPASLRFADPGVGSPLDFTSGDCITIEAWVNPNKIANGRQVYLVGKGRTGNAGFPAENHNWGLRLLGKDGGCHLSFLFRDTENRSQNDYHRWTSTASFPGASDWHHVAVTYQFGRGASIRGYIDGQPTKGTWDLGGESDEAPVVDDDQVWIGSALKDSPSNSFIGGLDEVAIYRTELAPERLAARWKVNQPKAYVTTVPIPADRFLVEVLEGMPDQWSWNFVAPTPSERYTQQILAFTELPKKYTPHGVIDDRSSPFVLWAHTQIRWPGGKQRLLLRSRNAARLYIDDQLIVENPFPSGKTDGHNPFVPVTSAISPLLRPLQPGDHEEVVDVDLPAGLHRLRLELVVGGKKHRPEVGETSVSLAPAGSDDFWVIGYPAGSAASSRPAPIAAFPLVDQAWLAWERYERDRMLDINQQRRATASLDYSKYWQRRHAWGRELIAQEPPPAYNTIDPFITARLAKEGISAAPLCDDYAFVRRIYLDCLGQPPSAEQVSEFLKDARTDKRSRLIDKLLADRGWADNWVGYWQDVLAENPNIVNPTLNNTGPFRWWIYESLLDNKPLDRFATELILMEGSTRYGGTAGFAVATENDAPLAAKAQNLGLAFLAFDMRCARCHDAPSHDFSQEDLFNLAAMLHRGEQTLPKTSTIPGDDASHASLMVKVTLKPGQKIKPRWPFEGQFQTDLAKELLSDPNDPREELAFRMTSPQNPRFAKVMVNRIWQRLMGRGIVEPVDDWETAMPTHPELLEFLAREFVANGYDTKHLARLIFNSQAYQRVPTADSELARLYAAPKRRRMTAEQVLDSLLVVAGKEAHTEEMNVDVYGSRLENSSINLALPTRAWRFTTMGNERDRPSLSLPAAQTAVTLLETFGWRAERQDPASYRDNEPTVLQPAIVANGVFAKRAAQLSEDSVFVDLALSAETPANFVESAYRQILSRPPTSAERDLFVALLADDFSSRKTGAAPGPRPDWPARDGVSWANHLQTKSNEIRVARQREVEKGDPPTTQLTSNWRERAEDMIWALVNSPEFVWLP